LQTETAIGFCASREHELKFLVLNILISLIFPKFFMISTYKLSVISLEACAPLTVLECSTERCLRVVGAVRVFHESTSTPRIILPAV